MEEMDRSLQSERLTVGSAKLTVGFADQLIAPKPAKYEVSSAP